MLGDDQRSRQRSLPEVGARGQALIDRSHAVLPCDVGGDVAAAYLGRAGVAVERCRDATAPSFAHAENFRYDGPRNFAAGAHRALLDLRETLGVTRRPFARRSFLP